MVAAGRFSMRRVYNWLLEENTVVPWYSLMMHNMARPKARVTLWMLCHGHLPTKDRLNHFGIISNTICNMCGKEEENADHVFFSCDETMGIWQGILHWLNISHNIQPWSRDINWILAKAKGRGWRARIFHMAVTEAIHEIWLYRNAIVFKNDTYRNNTLNRIKNSVVYMGWRNRRVREHIASLMV
ncbi:uncharacterized protein LOC131658672 [Vicia villosa]|uniref:uncharacterized protein LOC131658672 n=1 Tax=Vicia villosa TaxID=3911 RepID=UPI00273C4BCB|nr:uncharacterized protein LOC131658672 [Vicia villosa]